MILVLLLTGIFIFMAFYSVIFVHNTLIRYILFFIYITAIVIIWNPGIATIIAHYFGMGRGIDFIFVLFSVVVVNITVFIVKHLNFQHRSITKIARYIAINNAQTPEHYKNNFIHDQIHLNQNGNNQCKKNL